MSEFLLRAAAAGDLSRVQELLAAGADCNARDAEGATALMLAAHAGRLDVVHALVGAGADVNATDARGWGALAKAVYNADLDRGFADVVEALVRAGASVEAPIGYGIRPLMLAAGYGETAVVEALLKAGADVLARLVGMIQLGRISVYLTYSFFTLLALEIVLGIDNVIFISILSSKLPAAQQPRARQIGLGLAMFLRIGLLISISWVIRLTAPLFSVFSQEISGRDIILIAGGMFLMAKATHEIHQKLEGETGHTSARVAPTFASVIIQILLLDMVFSLDSVITAVGLVRNVSVMITAIVASVIFMMAFANPVSAFVDRHPTVKILALSFLLLVGMTLMVEGFDVHVPKGYIYFSMAFSMFVEMLNLRMRRPREAPVKLHEAIADGNPSAK